MATWSTRATSNGAPGSGRRLRPDGAEYEVTGEQPRVHARVAAAHEAHLDVVEARKKAVQLARREHPKVRGIVFGRATAQEAQSVLEAERVRHRPDEDALVAQDPPDLGDERVRKLEMLEKLAGDDGVEARVVERQRLLDVRLDGLDS